MELAKRLQRIYVTFVSSVMRNSTQKKPVKFVSLRCRVPMVIPWKSTRRNGNKKWTAKKARRKNERRKNERTFYESLHGI